MFNHPSQPTNCSHQRNPRTPKISSSDIFYSFSPNYLFPPPPFFSAESSASNEPPFPSTFQNCVFKVQLTCHLLQEAFPDSIISLPARHLGRSLLLQSLPYIPTPWPWGCQYRHGFTHTVRPVCVQKLMPKHTGVLACCPSIGKSHLPKQAHDHPETKGCNFSSPCVSLASRWPRVEGRESKDEPSP